MDEAPQPTPHNDEFWRDFLTRGDSNERKVRGIFKRIPEWHLLGRVDGPEIRPGRPDDNEAAAVAAHRWWSLADLQLSADTFFPEGLVEIVERLHTEGTPTKPWTTYEGISPG